MTHITHYRAVKHSYVQQLTAIAKRAHAWAFIVPVSKALDNRAQHVTHHSAVRY